MGCGKSRAIVDTRGASNRSLLARPLSRYDLRRKRRFEPDHDDLFLLRCARLPAPLLRGDDDDLSDITHSHSAQESVSGVATCGSLLFGAEDLERRRQEVPTSIEEDLFVYDDAVVSKNEAQAKHWRIEGRRPLPPTTKRAANGTGGGKCTAELFSFTDFNVRVDEVELSVGHAADSEVGLRQAAKCRNGQQTLLGAKVTRTYGLVSNSVAAMLRAQEQGPRATTCRRLNDFTVDTVIGHAARVKCLSVLPNGRSFVSCSSEDASVVLRNLKDGGGEGIFTGHQDTVICTAISPDGKYLATASKDRSLTLWDAIITKVLHVLHHEKVVICCCFSPDSRTVISGSQDRVCRVWDVRQGAEVLAYSQHGGIIVSMAFSPDGNHVCSTSADRTLRVWSATSGRTHLTLKGHSGIVLACSYSSNGEYIISNDETYLCVWLAKDGTCKIRLAVTDVAEGRRPTGGSVRLGWTSSCAAPGPFVHYAAVACTNRFVYIFDIRDGKEYGHVFCKAPVYCLTSGGNDKIVFGDSFGNIYIQTLS